MVMQFDEAYKNTLSRRWFSSDYELTYERVKRRRKWKNLIGYHTKER